MTPRFKTMFLRCSFERKPFTSQRKSLWCSARKL
jgi:hypothetical protein